MIGRRLGLIHKNQQGLTLVELLIAIVLVGIVTAGITITIGHMFTWTTRTNNHMMLVRQVQSAGYWVSRDFQQSQLPNAISELPFTLKWESGNITTEVTYELHGTDLRRTSRVNDDIQATGVIARFIDPATTVESSGYLLRFTVIATVGTESGYQQREERLYEVQRRPDAPPEP